MVFREDVLKVPKGKVNRAYYHIRACLHKTFLVLGAVCNSNNPGNAELLLCSSRGDKVDSVIISSDEQQVSLRGVSFLQNV